MTTSLWYALIGAGLICLGLHSLTLTPHVLRKIIALNIMGNGVFLMLISLARRLPDAVNPAPDPVPQAMVLTGVVVAVSSTALALALLRRYYEAADRTHLPEDDAAWGIEEQAPDCVVAMTGEEDNDDH